MKYLIFFMFFIVKAEDYNIILNKAICNSDKEIVKLILDNNTLKTHELIGYIKIAEEISSLRRQNLSLITINKKIAKKSIALGFGSALSFLLSVRFALESMENFERKIGHFVISADYSKITVYGLLSTVFASTAIFLGLNSFIANEVYNDSFKILLENSLEIQQMLHGYLNKIKDF